MRYRFRSLAIILSCAGATGVAVHYSLSTIPKESKTSNEFSTTTNKDFSPSYISASFYEPIIAGRYQQALFYVKLVRSDNFHLRQHGLNQLARFQRLPSALYVLLGQQLNYRQSIRLARTSQANEHFFPVGLPFIFNVDQNKMIVSSDFQHFDEDEFLFQTLRHFMEQIHDDQNRPIDTLSEHYRNLFESFFDQIDSQTAFDLVQHFESEHADISQKAIRRYRSNFELELTFLHALRGFADRFPNEVVRLNGLQILKYLYEKRRENVSFVRFVGKILLLLSRDQQTHRAFHAVGWLKILHRMAVDQNNIVYSLLASTILANLDRSNDLKTSNDENEFVRPTLNFENVPSKLTPMEILLGEKQTKTPNSEENPKKNRFQKFIDRVKLQRNLQKNSKNEAKIEPISFADEVFGDKVILFSPTFYNLTTIEPDLRWNQEPLVDVVFIHGLAGSAFKSWRDGSREDDSDELINDCKEQLLDNAEESIWFEDSSSKNFRRSSSCWPKDWLSKDLSTCHIRMMAVDYESRVSEWQLASLPKNLFRRSMKQQAEDIFQQLKTAGLGKRPIIWVAHSMGGLLTKYILTDERNQSIRTATKACVFFSVPHFGAELASVGIRHAFFVRPTIEIQELQPNSPNLIELHEKFLDFLKQNEEIQILSFGETEKTTFSLRYQTVVVPSASSKIDVGQYFILNKNHIQICKPNSKSAIEYQKVRDLIEQIYLQTKFKPEKEPQEFLGNICLFSSPIDDEIDLRY